jgi:hypothetical protein
VGAAAPAAACWAWLAGGLWLRGCCMLALDCGGQVAIRQPAGSNVWLAASACALLRLLLDRLESARSLPLSALECRCRVPSMAVGFGPPPPAGARAFGCVRRVGPARAGCQASCPLALPGARPFDPPPAPCVAMSVFQKVANWLANEVRVHGGEERKGAQARLACQLPCGVRYLYP